MDIVVEFFLELYMELMTLIVPEKYIGKSTKVIATVLAILVIAGVFALVIWGVSWILEGNLWGIAPLVGGIIISLARIIAGILLSKRNH
jgi:hypothetical protein